MEQEYRKGSEASQKKILYLERKFKETEDEIKECQEQVLLWEETQQKD